MNDSYCISMFIPSTSDYTYIIMNLSSSKVKKTVKGGSCG